MSERGHQRGCCTELLVPFHAGGEILVVFALKICPEVIADSIVPQVCGVVRWRVEDWFQRTKLRYWHGHCGQGGGSRSYEGFGAFQCWHSSETANLFEVKGAIESAGCAQGYH